MSDQAKSVEYHSILFRVLNICGHDYDQDSIMDSPYLESLNGAYTHKWMRKTVSYGN